MHASHLLHTNKYATFWDNLEVIIMINCQVIGLNIIMFILKSFPSANNCPFFFLFEKKYL